MVLNYKKPELSVALNRLWFDFYFNKVNPKTGKRWKKSDLYETVILAGIKQLSGGNYGSNF